MNTLKLKLIKTKTKIILYKITKKLDFTAKILQKKNFVFLIITPVDSNCQILVNIILKNRFPKKQSK